MKKFFAVMLSIMLTLSLFSVACDKPAGEKDTLTFYAPDGAPALAIAEFIEDDEDFGIDADITYSVVASSDIGPTMAQGKGDFIVMPVNAASKLYKANKNDPYIMAGVVTHGNLYIMSSDNTTSLDGLLGKVVGVIGQGLVPDLTLKAILSDNNLLDKVVVGDTATEGKITLRYFAQAPEMMPLLKQGVISVGLLPEPAATNLTKVAPNREWTRLDIQELYDGEQKSYPQAVLMVKKSVYDKYKTQIDGMKTYFDSSAAWAKENPEDAVDAVNERLAQGVTPSLVAANITPAVIENCKIYYENASVSKTAVKNYINKIIAIAPQSAANISDDFFA
ncbi:MAG: ABC transporter substrate-binding protein [Clostridiales bacterium]|nr:ABC transporter substrate-binding protein [Clostridiales bacterium]